MCAELKEWNLLVIKKALVDLKPKKILIKIVYSHSHPSVILLNQKVPLEEQFQQQADTLKKKFI